MKFFVENIYTDEIKAFTSLKKACEFAWQTQNPDMLVHNSWVNAWGPTDFASFDDYYKACKAVLFG